MSIIQFDYYSVKKVKGDLHVVENLIFNKRWGENEVNLFKENGGLI